MISQQHKELNNAIDECVKGSGSMSHWYNTNEMLRDWIAYFKNTNKYDSAPDLKDYFVKFAYGIGHLRDLLVKGNNTAYL